MTESLRDRVEARLTRDLEQWLDAGDPEVLAADLTKSVFEEMGEARPCVTCGKGIGPAKVAKGYVQCYDCRTRSR